MSTTFRIYWRYFDYCKAYALLGRGGDFDIMQRRGRHSEQKLPKGVLESDKEYARRKTTAKQIWDIEAISPDEALVKRMLMCHWSNTFVGHSIYFPTDQIPWDKFSNPTISVIPIDIERAFTATFR